MEDLQLKEAKPIDPFDGLRIVLLNGPARSGKDTSAIVLNQDTKFSKLVKFAAPLKRAAAAIYLGGDDQYFADHFDTSENKDKPFREFLNKTPRQVQISLSEAFLKPFHDKTVFGQILANDIRADFEEGGIDTFFVSDSGFREEAEELVRQFGAKHIILFRLHREGYTFEGDSRNYVDLADLGVPCFDVTNVEGQPSQLINEIKAIVEKSFKETDNASE